MVQNLRCARLVRRREEELTQYVGHHKRLESVSKSACTGRFPRPGHQHRVHADSLTTMQASLCTNSPEHPVVSPFQPRPCLRQSLAERDTTARPRSSLERKEERTRVESSYEPAERVDLRAVEGGKSRPGEKERKTCRVRRRSSPVESRSALSSRSH